MKEVPRDFTYSEEFVRLVWERIPSDGFRPEFWFDPDGNGGGYAYMVTTTGRVLYMHASADPKYRDPDRVPETEGERNSNTWFLYLHGAELYAAWLKEVGPYVFALGGRISS